jgi:hypothetical protein
MRRALVTTVVALGLAVGTSACSKDATKSGVKGKIVKEAKTLNVTADQAQCIVDKLWTTYDGATITKMNDSSHTFTADETAKITEIAKGCVTK